MKRLDLRWLVALMLLAPPALANSVVDGRILMPYADDNVLQDAGEDRVSSPDASFTPPQGFDSASFLHLGIHKALDLGKGFVPEAAIYVRFEISPDDVKRRYTLRDDSSYVRLNYFFEPEKRDKWWFLELFPIDGDRLRLGFAREQSWGGSDTFPRNFRGSVVPAARTGVDLGQGYVWIGAKTAQVRSAAESQLANEEGNSTLFVERTYYGGMLGFGAELGTPGLWLEANGGYFRKSTNNKAEVLGEPIHSGGVSARLKFAAGVPLDRRIDLDLFRVDPVLFDVTKAAVPSFGLSGRISVEGTWLMQTLADLDNPGSTKNEQSWQAMLSSGIQYQDLRILLDFGFRELTAIVWEVPGFFPNAAMPENVKTKPQLGGVLSVDYTFRELGLTPYGHFSGERPAVYEGVVSAGPNAPTTVQGSQRVVVRGVGAGDWDILPEGQKELPIWGGKAGLRWTYADMFTLLGELKYTYDPNRAQLRKDAFGYNSRVLIDPHILGFGLLASVKF